MKLSTDLGVLQEQCELLAENTEIILDRGVITFDKIISVLKVTGRLLPEDIRDLLFHNYEQTILLYKYTNELLRVNKIAEYYRRMDLVRFREDVLSCLLITRDIIGFLKISGYILSDNYVNDISEIRREWYKMSHVCYCIVSDGRPNEFDENDYPSSYEYNYWYENIYGKIEYEDEYTQPIVLNKQVTKLNQKRRSNNESD